jgi:hypothetical protein
MDREITKQEFRGLYIKYGQSQKDSGWTQAHWDYFHEKETDKRYFFTEPISPDEKRMFMDVSKNIRRIFLLTEEAEDSLFNHPEF